MQEIKDFLKFIESSLDRKSEIFLVKSQQSSTKIKFESLNYKSRTYFIFRLETENVRYEVREKVKDLLIKNKKKFKEKYAISTEPVLDIPVSNKKIIRIVFKNSRRYINKLKNEWYNDLIDGAFNSKKDIAPNDRNELETLKQINSKIMEPMSVRIGNKTYKNIIGLIGVRGEKKADFVLVDKDKKELCWISYKKGNAAKDFQQYSGMSKTKSSMIHEHPEVEQFRQEVVENWEGISEGGRLGVYRKIKDDRLKKQSIFGKDYGRRHSEENVTFFVQGNPIISIRNDVLTLDFGTKIVKNGSLNQLRREYDPVIGARKGEGNRIIEYGNQNIRGVRGGVFSEGYMSVRKSKEI